MEAFGGLRAALFIADPYRVVFLIADPAEMLAKSVSRRVISSRRARALEPASSENARPPALIRRPEPRTWQRSPDGRVDWRRPPESLSEEEVPGSSEERRSTRRSPG